MAIPSHLRLIPSALPAAVLLPFSSRCSLIGEGGLPCSRTGTGLGMHVSIHRPGNSAGSHSPGIYKRGILRFHRIEHMPLYPRTGEDGDNEDTSKNEPLPSWRADRFL